MPLVEFRFQLCRLAGAEERLRFLDVQSTQDQVARQDAQAETRVLRAEVDSLRRHVAALEEQLEGSQSEVQVGPSSF